MLCCVGSHPVTNFGIRRIPRAARFAIILVRCSVLLTPYVYFLRTLFLRTVSVSSIGANNALMVNRHSTVRVFR